MFRIDENKAVETAYKMGFDAGKDLSDEHLREAVEQIRRFRAERDEAFRMSRCECGEDECCANLVKHRDRIQSLENAMLAIMAVVVLPYDERSHEDVRLIATSVLSKEGGDADEG